MTFLFIFVAIYKMATVFLVDYDIEELLLKYFPQYSSFDKTIESMNTRSEYNRYLKSLPSDYRSMLFGVLPNNILEKEYPGIINKLSRGDIIENIHDSGYGIEGAEGITFFDGEKIIQKCKSVDNYGSIPASFKVITEFPIDYWDYYKVNREYVDAEAESLFTWHSDNIIVYIDITQLNFPGELPSNKNVFEFFYKNEKYILVYTDVDIDTSDIEFVYAGSIYEDPIVSKKDSIVSKKYNVDKKNILYTSSAYHLLYTKDI